jgi:ATP-binding cassette subfamily B protein
MMLAIATFCRASLINKIAEKVVTDIRIDVYSNIIKLSPSFFEDQKTSDLVSRLSSDTILLSTLIASIFTALLRNSLMAIGGLILLFITSTKLTCYVLIVVPVVIGIIIIIGRKVKSLSRQNQENISKFCVHIEESLFSIKTVQAFTREDYEISLFNQEVKRSLSSAIAWINFRALLAAIVITLVFASIVLVLWVGGHDVLTNKMNAGQLSSFIFYSVLVASSVVNLSEVVGDLNRASGASERLLELLNARSSITDCSTPKSLPTQNIKTIELQEIDFAYPSRPTSLIIKNFSLKLTQGETIAIVGPSGAGKTTIFNLLLRFYEPNKGSIKFDGIDIKDLSLKELREQFAIVSQEPVLFSASAYDNIRYGKIDAGEEEVKEAAQRAEIYDFLESLPEGIHSLIGEKGMKLSGGQKQRIAIARAILKNPPILLLDEATSNLDTQNEQRVQQALGALREGRTTITIAHRISTIIAADKIIVMNNGQIDSVGTHQELIDLNGLYAQLATLQS